jgi:hypothetical protein
VAALVDGGDGHVLEEWCEGEKEIGCDGEEEDEEKEETSWCEWLA